MENDKLSSSKNHDVFDLYGGKAAVLERVDKLIRLKLREKPNDFEKMILEDLIKSGKPSYEKVIKFLREKAIADCDIFLVFKPYLHLCLGNAFGRPYFASEEIRDYWRTEKKNKPMRMVVAEPLSENPFEGESGLELYIAFRAVGKFYKEA